MLAETVALLVPFLRGTGLWSFQLLPQSLLLEVTLEPGAHLGRRILIEITHCPRRQPELRILGGAYIEILQPGRDAELAHTLPGALLITVLDHAPDVRQCLVDLELMLFTGLVEFAGSRAAWGPMRERHAGNRTEGLCGSNVRVALAGGKIGGAADLPLRPLCG